MGLTACITGATSGFGKATAEKLAAAGYDVIITGRRKDRLEELATSLKKTYAVKVLALNFDVRDKQAVNAQCASLSIEWQRIDVLVNNAGLAAGRDFFDDASMEDWETMIDTNIKGLLYISRALLPYIKASPHGHIVNIGSIAGKQAYERGNVYCATKFAVDALSKTMRIDLLKHKIRVTAIHPGAAETEFSLVRLKGDEAAANAVYEGYIPLYAEDVADAVHYCVTRPAHVCINELVVTCTAQADAYYLYKG